MTFEYDSVMALKTLSFKSIFLLISCLSVALLLSTCHCDLVPQFNVFQLILLKIHTHPDSFYTVLCRITHDSKKVKTLNVISHISLFSGFVIQTYIRNKEYLHPWKKNKRLRDDSFQQTQGCWSCEVCGCRALCPMPFSVTQEKNI